MNTSHSSHGKNSKSGDRPSTGESGNGYIQLEPKRMDMACPRVNKGTAPNFWTSSCLMKQLHKEGNCRGTTCETGLALLTKHKLKPREKIVNPDTFKKKAPACPIRGQKIRRSAKRIKEAQGYHSVPALAKLLGTRKEQLNATMRHERVLPEKVEVGLKKLLRKLRRTAREQ